MINSDLSIAKNINTSTEQLRELVAKTNDETILAEVAKHPNTSIDLLLAVGLILLFGGSQS